MSEEKKYPEPIVGIVIYNDQGEVLLTKNSKKWGDLWNIPGGHIESGEAITDAVVRETEEETGLVVADVDYIDMQDIINPEGFHKKIHFIALGYSAKVISGEVRLTEENEEFVWVEPQEAVEKYRLNRYSKVTLENYLKKEESFEDRYFRALADYQNLQKQTAKEKMDFVKFANESLLHSFLPIYDNLKTAIAHAGDENNDGWLTGVKYVVKQFADALLQSGVEEIKTVGERFDHATMEAVETEETEDEKMDESVSRELKSGYRLNGRVIAAARVVVYKKK